VPPRPGPRDLAAHSWGAGRAGTARVRLHLVRHRTALKNRIHATLLAFGKPCPVSDLFGAGGRQLLARLALPEPWIGNITAALASSTTWTSVWLAASGTCGTSAPTTPMCRC
jgi:hypothetical protein